MTPASWNEASNAFGVTETALRWGLAEGRVGGPNAFQTFILVANPDVTAANITLTILRTTGAPIVKTLAVPAGGRLTITTGPGQRRAGAGRRIVRRHDRPRIGRSSPSGRCT